VAEFSESRAPQAPLDLWFARMEDEEEVWRTGRLGPPIDEVATRISSVPREYLDPRVSLAAIGGDTGLLFSTDAPQQVLVSAQQYDASRRGAAIALWLWASEDLVGPFTPHIATQSMASALAALAFRLAPVVDPQLWLSDPDRREEAARLFLLWSGYLPEGEDVTVARAMWDRHDSLRQSEAMRAMLADHQHRVEVTAALRAQAAREAAARYTHE
jgi:hypothetical protein